MSNSPGTQGFTPDKGRRRSLRVLLSVSVIIRGKDANGVEMEEETKTLVVNAHGALIQLRSDFKANQRVTMTHKMTKETLDCRIVYVGSMQGGKAQVGIEFAKPSPKYWQISFPPDDWNVADS